MWKYGELNRLVMKCPNGNRYVMKIMTMVMGMIMKMLATTDMWRWLTLSPMMLPRTVQWVGHRKVSGDGPSAKLRAKVQAKRLDTE